MDWLLFQTAMIPSAAESCERSCLEWRQQVRKQPLSGSKMLKKLSELQTMLLRHFLQIRSSSDLQFRYDESQRAAVQAIKMFKQRSG